MRWLIFLLLPFVTSCAIMEIRKDFYKRDMGAIPQEEQQSLESIEAVSVGATEINKGMNEVYSIIKYVNDDKKMAESFRQMEPRLKAMLDFSYQVMGWLGVAWKEIDWNDPKQYFDQIKSQKDALNAALKEKAEIKLQYEKDKAEFIQNLASKDKVVKDKDAEMADRDGKWSAKLSWWFKIGFWVIVGLVILGGLFYLYGVVQRVLIGIPLKAAMMGPGLAYKMVKQTVKGVQIVRDNLKAKIDQAKTEEEKNRVKQMLDEISTTLRKEHDEDTVEGIKSVKAKVIKK